MSYTSLATRLTASLPCGVPGLFNPWKDNCPFAFPGNNPNVRLERLAQHLDCDPAFILVGEAPGYQGCRYSGIAFTSERLLMEGKIPRIPKLLDRLSTNRKLPFSEPSATIVWSTLKELGIAECTILWNALQLHPYRPGEPWSNRTPTNDELGQGADALRLLVKTFPSAKLVAVGKKAEHQMKAIGISPVAAVRHPANGGAKEFASGIEALVSGNRP